MSEKITCLILSYNEEHRIRNALTHALKWADEVIVIDKSSTDQTERICSLMGAKVVRVPFSKQGHEDCVSNCKLASNDWIWIFTPGEVPTRELIKAGKELIAEDVDMILVPIKMYSFGIHHAQSPWGMGLQPRLLNRTRARICNNVHANFYAAATRTRTIQVAPETFVLHQTHATAEGFMRSHCDYMTAEALKSNIEDVYRNALTMASAYDGNFSTDVKLLKQFFAWKIYWLGVALHCREKMDGENVPLQYGARADILAQRWV